MSLSYDDKKDVIDSEIKKRRSKWQLKAITWMDFDDISQLIRIHIMNKWDMWDQSRPIEPWLNRLITNRITNLIRDNYWSFSRPCLRCDANQGGGLCEIYQTQCSGCPLYAKWVKKKKKIYDLKIPVSYDDQIGPYSRNIEKDRVDDFIDYDSSVKKIHLAMKKKLKPEHFRIYKMLYILEMNEESVAKSLGYKENKYNKKNKYKQIENYKRKFKEEARVIIREEEI